MIDDNQFFVEAVVGEKQDSKGQTLFLVKWEGYHEKEADWEPPENIPEEFILEWQKQDDELEEIDEEDDAEETSKGISAREEETNTAEEAIDTPDAQSKPNEEKSCRSNKRR